jgi:hypothetical protein
MGEQAETRFGKLGPPKKRRLVFWFNVAFAFYAVMLPVCSLSQDPTCRYILGLAPPFGAQARFDLGNGTLSVRADYYARKYSFVEIRLSKGARWRRTSSVFEVYDFANKVYTSEELQTRKSTGREYRTAAGGAKSVVARDINADGLDEVIVADRYGTPRRFWVVSLNDPPVTLAQFVLHARDLQPGDLDADGVFEFVTDTSLGWKYWKTAPLSAATVILKWNGKNYVVATPEFLPLYSKDLSKLVAGYPSELEAWRKGLWKDRAPRTSADDYVRPPPVLSQILLSYVCFGEGQRARELVDELWPPEDPHKDVFLREFDYELRTSWFWDETNAATAPENRWPYSGNAGLLQPANVAEDVRGAIVRP